MNACETLAVALQLNAEETEEKGEDAEDFFEGFPKQFLCVLSFLLRFLCVQ
jgi:hypothetical protein